MLNELNKNNEFSSSLTFQIEAFYEDLKLHNIFFHSIYEKRLNPFHIAKLLNNIRYLISHTPLFLNFAIKKGENSLNYDFLINHYKENMIEEAGHKEWAENDISKLNELKGIKSDTISTKLLELINFIETLIAEDFVLLLAYKLFGEYIAVVAVPESVKLMRQNCNISSDYLSVFINHAILDKHHSKENCQLIERVIQLEPSYKEKFQNVISKACQKYFEFLEDIINSSEENKPQENREGLAG